MDSVAHVLNATVETHNVDTPMYINNYFSGGHKDKHDYFMKSDKNDSSEIHRFWLSCRWVNKVYKWVLIIAKNPSTGYSKKSDQTLSKLRNLLKKEGFDGFIIVNRIPNVKKVLPKHEFKNATGAINKKNVNLINEFLKHGPDALICAWGSEIPPRCGLTIEETLPIMGLCVEKLNKRRIPIKVLGMNKNNVPMHPASRCKISLMDYEYSLCDQMKSLNITS